MSAGTLTFLFLAVLALNAAVIWLAWRLLAPVFMRRHFAPPRRRPTPLPPGARDRAEAIGISVNGAVIRGWLVRPEYGTRAVAVLAHGWGQEAGRLGPMAAHLAKRGIVSMPLDLRGHGRSEACPDYNIARALDDLGAAREWVGERDDLAGLPAVVVGFSFSGLAAALSVSRDRLWDGGVVLGAPSAPLRAIAYFLNGKRLPGRFLSRLLADHVREGIGIDPRELSTAKHLPHAEVPVLVAHGTEDPIVPVEEGRRIAAFVPPEYRSTYWVEGAKHGELLGREDVAERIVRFIDECVVLK